MANFFSGLFRSNDKPQTTHPPSVLQGFSQYASEYIMYCIEQEHLYRILLEMDKYKRN